MRKDPLAKMSKSRVRIPSLPTYPSARTFMEAGFGESPQAIRDMISAIFDQTGTPQDPVDWSDPDTWIDERLQGESARIAKKIWDTNNNTLNPRHTYGIWMFISNFDLMSIDENSNWTYSDKGRKFLTNDAELIVEIDELEGMFVLLELLAGLERAKRGDLITEWKAYLEQFSTFKSDSSCKATLRHRLINLIDRGLVDRDGNHYQITNAGREWLRRSPEIGESDPRKEILDGVKRFNIQQRDLLRDRLANINPYKFEELIGELLESMGYEDVEVTKASGDKGVDVVGKVQVGITTIIEVVQVKRISGTISRNVIDSLRGALPYHKAIRGTIITLGRFAKNCEAAALFPGAAPITLIDGSKLIELLIENGVGIRKSKSIELLDVDEEYFDSKRISDIE